MAINFSARQEIVNDEELKEAFDQLEKVFDAPKGTDDGQKSERLVKLISKYEERYSDDEKTITVKDLRIGNVLLVVGDNLTKMPYVVEWRHIKWASDDCDDFISNHWEMNITDEILIKLGFQKHNIYGDDYEIFAKKHGNYYIQIRKGYDMWEEENYYVLHCENPLLQVMVTHVHNLQNILWDISDKELDVSKLFEDV